MYIEKMKEDEWKYTFLLESLLKKCDGIGQIKKSPYKAHRFQVERWILHDDGKMYARVCSNDGRKFYVNDYNSFATLTKEISATRIFSEEEIKNIDRNYTKYMLWQNLGNRQEYCDNYIRNQIFLNSDKIRQLDVEERKAVTAKLKRDSQEYLDELTREIVDEVFFYTFYKGQFSSVGAGCLVLNATNKNSIEEEIFFDDHKPYMLDMIDRLTYGKCWHYDNEKLYYSLAKDKFNRDVLIAREIEKTTRRRKKMVATSFETHSLKAFLSNFYNHETLKDVLKDTADFVTVVDLPFDTYVDAYNSVYSDKGAEHVQAME